MIIRTKLTAVFLALASQLELRPPPAPVPPPAPAQTFRVTTDNSPRAEIAGVILPAPTSKPRGTLFLLHGYGKSKEMLYGWDWIRRDLGWNIVLFDFREHGQSTHSIHLCSLGYQEIWDVKAVVDYAEQQRLPKPYAFYGVSMGGTVGLRWAAQDPRIAGVLAISPYRDGISACRDYLWGKFKFNFCEENLQGGFWQMVKAVDLPRDIAAGGRDDLRTWVICGDHDYWPASDERAILASNSSPARYKRLYVIPGGTHSNLWSWKGNRTTPGHDQIVRDFLDDCCRR